MFLKNGFVPLLRFLVLFSALVLRISDRLQRDQQPRRASERLRAVHTATSDPFAPPEESTWVPLFDGFIPLTPAEREVRSNPNRMVFVSVGGQYWDPVSPKAVRFRRKTLSVRELFMLFPSEDPRHRKLARYIIHETGDFDEWSAIVAPGDRAYIMPLSKAIQSQCTPLDPF